MSMIASSTTSPIAIARPPITMMFSPMPAVSSTATAPRSETGIATALMIAARALKRNTNRTTSTSSAPASTSDRTLPTAVSMKFAGRKSRGWASICTPSSAGRSSSSACSTPRVTGTMLAPYWACTIRNTPGVPFTAAALIDGAGAMATVATSPSVSVTPSFWTSGRCAMSAGATACASVAISTRWFAFSMNPAPSRTEAPRAAASTSCSASPCRTSFRGSTWICHWRTSPPKTFTSATPGTESRCGLRVVSTNVRMSISERVAEVRPMPSVVLVEEVSGVIVGVATPAGSWPASSASRSPTSWRSR